MPPEPTRLWENQPVTASARLQVRAAAAVLLVAALAGWPGAQPAAASVWAVSTGTAATAAAPQAIEPLAWLDAEQVWSYSTGDGVTVAVIDSGVDATHPELSGKVILGEDFVDGSTDARTDPVGHGTAVASIIAGKSSGLAPDVTVLPVRVLDEDNRYRSAATVAEGVAWAVREGADVINLSLGGAGQSPALRTAIDLAMANDVVIVACTGNLRDETGIEVWYPAREPGVVAVTGLTWSDGSPPEHWTRSVGGPEAVLAAPAVLTAAAPGGGYREVQGTSFAAALVTGAAALVRARWPDATAGEVVYRLVATAEDLGEPGRDPEHGFGLLDPMAALTAPLPQVSVNPLDTRARHGEAGLGPAPAHPDGGRNAALPDASARPAKAEPAGVGAEPPAGRAGSPAPAGVVVTVLTGLAVLALPVAVVGSRARPAGAGVARRPLRCRSRSR
jgi:type VII secretion-associated serine protease mycosin